MKLEPDKTDYYFDQCDPIIKKSLSAEQSKEIKRLLALSRQYSEHGSTKINFNLWFLHLYFVTLYFKKEQLSVSKRFKEYNTLETNLSIISIIFSFVFTFGMIFAIFLALYFIKSFAGIDLFEEKHLIDFFKWSKDANINDNQLLSTLFYWRL